MKSLIDSNNKVKEVNSQQLVHHGLIKILIKDALQNLRIPITWSVFINLPAEDEIKTLTHDINPSISEEEAKKEEEDTELDGDEMGEEGTNTEEHAERRQGGWC